MDNEVRREDLPADTVELADELLRRLNLAGHRGRIELEFEQGRTLKVWTHLNFSRSELVRFDAPT